MNKKELLNRILESRKPIEVLCERATEQTMELRTETQPEWTLKAFIAHLAFWEHATLDVLSGTRSADSLKDVHAINLELLVKTKRLSASEVLQEFARSGERLIAQINDLTPERLPGEGPWADGISLIEHLLDDTCVHYQEHFEKIRSLTKAGSDTV